MAKIWRKPKGPEKGGPLIPPPPTQLECLARARAASPPQLEAAIAILEQQLCSGDLSSEDHTMFTYASLEYIDVLGEKQFAARREEK